MGLKDIWRIHPGHIIGALIGTLLSSIPSFITHGLFDGIYHIIFIFCLTIFICGFIGAATTNKREVERLNEQIEEVKSQS